MKRPTRTPGRTVLVVLHVLALGACGWVVREIAADAEAKPAAVAPDDKHELRLEPAEWVFDGAGTAPTSSPPAPGGTLPAMPASAPRLAVRVSPDGRVTAELYGPVNLPEVLTHWRADGWTVDEPQPNGPQRYALRRAGRSVVALALQPKRGGGCQLMTFPADREQPLTERNRS